jgi:hypothetical protein
MRLPKGPLSAHRNCQTSGPRFRCLLIRLPCCIPASSIAVAMRKNSYAVSPKPGLRQTVGVNCFAAATLLRCNDCCFALLSCLPTNQTEMQRRATFVPHVFSLRSKPENFGSGPTIILSVPVDPGSSVAPGTQRFESSIKRGLAWSRSTPLHQRSGALAELLKRDFQRTKFLRAQFR